MGLYKCGNYDKFWTTQFYRVSRQECHEYDEVFVYFAAPLIWQTMTMPLDDDPEYGQSIYKIMFLVDHCSL